MVRYTFLMPIVVPPLKVTPARWLIFLRTLTLSSLFLVAVKASAEDLMFPVPPGAESPEHVILDPGFSEQDYFWIKASYPDTPALAHYSKLFDGWLECTSWAAGWDGILRGDRYLHRFMRHWANVENTLAITLLFQYSSPGFKPRAQPDNDRQFVAVIREYAQNAEWHFGEMRIDCTKAKGHR